MKQHSNAGVRTAFGATILVAIFLTGLASYRVWSPDTAESVRPVVRAKEKRENDMPPPGFLKRRWGTGSATYQPKQQPLGPSAASAVSNWIPIGPTQMTDVDSNTILEPSQGRVNCVAVSPTDPNRILIGAASGGAWLSTDGGQNWSPRTDHLPVLGVADIEFAPSDPSIVYMATGDGIAFATPSIGVYKSTDGGVSWNPTGLTFNPIAFTILKKLAVHPTNPNIVYVVELNRIYKTTNGGTNWDPINPGGLNNDFPMYDVKLKPNNPDVVYAMSHNGFFRRSDNGGASWTPTGTTRVPGLPPESAVRRCQIAVTPVNENVVYVICAEQSSNGLNGVYVSTDGGNSFSATGGTAGALSDFGNQADYDMSIAVSPINSSEVYIGGVLPLRSPNAGASWSQISGFTGSFPPPGFSITHVDIHDLQFAHGALYACTDGGTHRSTDLGAHWTDLSQKLQIAQIYHFSISDQNGGLVYAGEQDNGLNRLQNGKWEHVKAGDWGQPLVHPQSTDLVFAGSNGGNVKSLDGFKFFEVNLNIASEPSRFPGAVFAVDPNDLQIAYAGLRNIHKSTTFGDSGTYTPGTNFSDNMVVHAIAVAPSNTQVIYASRADFSNAMMLRSTNGGASFGDISGNGLPNKLATGIAIDAANPDRVWVALQDSQGNVVYRTENGGASWTNYSGSLTTLSAHTIVYRKGSNDAVFVGTNAGVFARDASDSDWTPFNTNLPNVTVSDLQINYSTGRLRAATYGRGVWETLLPGTSLNALLNVSTRLQVGTGDNILIGGFILTGPGDKTVLFRAIGPSLSSILPGAIADTTLELRNAAGTLLGSNDNWKVTQIGGNITGNQFFAIKSSGVAPTHDNEAAIVATLAPGQVQRGAPWREQQHRHRCRGRLRFDPGNREIWQHQHARFCADGRRRDDRRFHSRQSNDTSGRARDRAVPRPVWRPGSSGRSDSGTAQ